METNNIEMITRLVLQAIDQNKETGNGFVVPIGVSARHIHLTQEHVEALFGPGYQLTKKKALMGGQFASNETVTIVGLKLRAIENVTHSHNTAFLQINSTLRSYDSNRSTSGNIT